jgi:hypothetical protein
MTAAVRIEGFPSKREIASEASQLTAAVRIEGFPSKKEIASEASQ